MGKICSFCKCTYDLPRNGGCGVQPPRGDELCGGNNTFCKNPDAAYNSYLAGRPYVHPDEKKRWQKRVDEMKRKKAAWEAASGKNPSGSSRGSQTITTTVTTTVTTGSGRKPHGSDKKPSTSKPTSRPSRPTGFGEHVETGKGVSMHSRPFQGRY